MLPYEEVIVESAQIIYTYYFCEPCGNEWKNKSDFIRKCPKCKSENIYIS